MIGVVLTKRREEFYKLASKYALQFEEIFDISDTETLCSYEKIYTDGPAIPAGPFLVKDISSVDLRTIFIESPLIDAEVLLKQAYLRYTFEKFQDAIRVEPLSFSCTFEEPSIVDESTQVKIKPVILDKVQANPVIDKPVFEKEPTVDFQDIFNSGEPEPEPVQEREQESTFINEPPSSKVYPTDLFVQKPKQTQPVRRTSLQPGSIRVRGFTQRKKIFQVPVFTFNSLTDKTGTTTLTAALAVTMAIQQPSAKILYLDLDMSNPNYLLEMWNRNPGTDASVKTIAGLAEADFEQNISLLSETISVSQAVFSLITWGQTTFVEKRILAAQDFNLFINIIYNSFDLILVDMGKLQSTLDYQMKMLMSTSTKHFIIADGSTSRNVSTFIQLASQLPYNFEVIINKNVPQSGSFAITQQLRQNPIATVGYYRNIDRILTDQLPMQGTALFTELCELGGKL